MRPKNKEIVIVLPNRDECPAGKTKDEAKLLSLVTAEYDVAEDMAYFQLHKEKNRYLLKLVFVPGHSQEVQTPNGKKFVMFELIRNGINSVCRLDEDLNKRMAVIFNLLNNDDPNAKETVRSKLSAIVDAPDQLDHLLDLLLSDVQFNSFKYTVMDSSKTSCLLCVNGSGVSIRAMEAPFAEQDRLDWTDISEVACKQKRLVIRTSAGPARELLCLNKKAALAAQRHLRLYLGFVGANSAPPPPPQLSWIGRISQRIRKSFTRRPLPSEGARPVLAPESEKPVCAVPAQRQFAPSSTVPDSSFMSEDVMDNPVSNVEPSLKTNSTYDVSLGSDSSYRPTIQSLSNEELSHNGEKTSSVSKPDQQMLQQAANDDRLSFKTTSTYEVSLDSRHMVRPMTADGDSLGPGGGPLSSFPTSAARTSPSLGQVKRDVVVPERDRSGSSHSAINAPSVPLVMPPDAALRSGEHKPAPSGDTGHAQLSQQPPPPNRPFPTRTATEVSSGRAQCAITEPAVTQLPVSAPVTITPVPALETREEPASAVVVCPPAVKRLPDVPIRTVTDLSHKAASETGAAGAAAAAVVVGMATTTLPEEAHEETLIERSADWQSAMIGIAVPESTVSAQPDLPAGTAPAEQAPRAAPEPPVRVESEKSVHEKFPNRLDNAALISERREEVSELDTSPVAIATAVPHITVVDSSPTLLELADNDATSGETSPVTLGSDQAATALENHASLAGDLTQPQPATQEPITKRPLSADPICPPVRPDDCGGSGGKRERPEVLDLSPAHTNSAKPESRLPVSKQRSIPSPKVQRASRVPTRELASPRRDTGGLQSSMTVAAAQSPSDKENYQNDQDEQDDQDEEDSTQDSSVSIDSRPQATNFSRFESQEYKVDSKTTITTVSTVGDSFVKRSTQTEIATVKSTGIPTPKMYKSTTIITSTVKKPADVSKSPSNSATKIPTGIPRMSAK